MNSGLFRHISCDVQEEVVKNVDCAFKHREEGDLKGTFCRAKATLAKIKPTRGSMRFSPGMTRLCQMRLELDDEEAELHVIDANTT